MVSSIIKGGRSELQKMALSDPSRKQHSSKVKQYKRWLLNEQTSYDQYYLPFIVPFLDALGTEYPIIFSIDGSQVGKGCMALMISVVLKGKAIPIVWQVYRAKKGHLPESAHQALLAELVSLVNPDCKVVIVGDGEFDGCDWITEIEKLGWCYIVRTAKNSCIIENGWDDFTPSTVCLSPGESMFFEQIEFTKKQKISNLLIWQGKGYKEPLYLITNLDYSLQIQQFYKKRFKIEVFFRDQKSQGFHIQKSGLRDPKRLAKLLIATCLAYVLVIMAGTKAAKSVYYNEIARTDGNFLSIFQLGYRFILLLVDIRQWRAFSWKTDFCP